MAVVATLEQNEKSDNPSQTMPLRFITAASLFDGHDASINIMRRILQQHGAEIIHLGHNRSVQDIVRAALQEDVNGIAVSSYQGGHVEYFRYMVELLQEAGAKHIRVFGGGGGVIVPEEIRELEIAGVEKIYSPEDGRQLGLEGMLVDLIERTRRVSKPVVNEAVRPAQHDHYAIGRMITLLEEGSEEPGRLEQFREAFPAPELPAPVLGITGPGGSGKSSLTDEMLGRLLMAYPELNVAVLSIDPTKRRTGGALLGDRIRMNSLNCDRIFMRSMATRRSHLATNTMLEDSIRLLQSLNFDLILVETAGIGQSGSEIVDFVDKSLYVMTCEYGAATQLEKIDMIDYADFIVLNKFEKRGAQDALRDIRKQWRRSRQNFQITDEEIPVYPTIASQFSDVGVNRLFHTVCSSLGALPGKADFDWSLDNTWLEDGTKPQPALIPGRRQRYLSEISDQGREHRRSVEEQADLASRLSQLHATLSFLGDTDCPKLYEAYTSTQLEADADTTLAQLRKAYNTTLQELSVDALRLLEGWPAQVESVRSEQYSYTVRNREITGDNYTTSLSDLQIPKVAVPRYRDAGDILRFLMLENLPGHFPYTAGLYPYKRQGEDPTRMFAGEGTPERTNRRFHLVCLGQPAARLSTAFDSVTLYGEDPHHRPDIYGKIGNSGVSICSLDDMKKLYSGFDLCAKKTSVSMTINGPAPMILAFFMNAAIDQQIEKHLKESGEWDAAQKTIDAYFEGKEQPTYSGDLPEGHHGLGIALLGITGDQLVDVETYARIKKETLAQVRGTVQADILKEDQAQNTCIFSTEFALRMMGDIQSYFIEHQVRNYYSVSISGYHIAEAGANPITQLALTLANGFTFVEYYLARGMDINDFAPNLSFFFSNGVDPEYAVIGRVARRIWSKAMRNLYGANARSQMLKYHIQTSGRSLHAQEIQFNDIRTTLQALYAIYDNCNSLHTNAYDEAITTPTEESVRRAMAIQLIINRELGLTSNENPLQGSFVIEELTDLVEEAIYKEFDRLTDRGGVLGAMETMYQRGKIQDESMYYEGKKFDGSLPIIGVNTFLAKDASAEEETTIELIRSTTDEKEAQIASLEKFQGSHSGQSTEAMARLQKVAREGGNIFEELLETVKSSSLGQISAGLYQVGGQYRRNM